MKFPLLPLNEEARLADLYSYHCLDSGAESDFDLLTKLARDLLKAPIVLISLIDHDRQWFKSRVGMEMEETSRESSICAHAILGNGVFEIQDTLDDERFRDNPLLVLNGLRFYAGAPLVSSEGKKLGTFCIIDYRSRILSQEEKDQLEIFSRHTVALMEQRKQNIEKQLEDLESMGLNIR
jgi:GAF domain-containing protein